MLPRKHRVRHGLEIRCLKLLQHACSGRTPKQADRRELQKYLAFHSNTPAAARHISLLKGIMLNTIELPKAKATTKMKMKNEKNRQLVKDRN